MTPIPPPEYANQPNLWRAACELANFKEPYKSIDMLLAIAGPMLKEEKRQSRKDGDRHE